jgi:eukaryotic-like serine/threonine-protein kinase
MNEERWRQVQDLLEAVWALAPQDRTAYLDRHCVDAQLRREVVALVSADQEAEGHFTRLAKDAGVPQAGAHHHLPLPSLLRSGVRLGPYEIRSLLAVGGMGEVYEALDTRLDRPVAVKVLPQHLTGDARFRARFRREAQAISNLSHPHICELFDVGETEVGDLADQQKATDAQGDGAASGSAGRTVSYMVMERLIGETLASRLQNGALTAAEVLLYGQQIASALAAAHQKGVVHRDLKPANVMLTRNGVKLLDFGLVRRIDLDGMHSVPLQGPSLTQEGTLLGTLSFMSPEQLEGDDVDARSDIFALGAVLHEMATGRRAFEGSSPASLIAAIMEKEPEPISRLAPLAPPALDYVVSRCLAKAPEERWQDVRDVAAQLGWIAERGLEAGVPPAVARRRRARERLAWALAALVGVVAVSLGLSGRFPLPPDAPGAIRFEISPPEGTGLVAISAVSPEGTRIALVATDNAGESIIWLRSLDAFEARRLPGTEGALAPFWSPDGRSIAFFANGELRRVDLDGSVRTLCAAPGRLSGTWGSRGDILFGFAMRELMRVPDTGGIPTRVPVMPHDENQDILGFWPHFLPDGVRFLVSVWHPESPGIYVASLDSDERRRLFPVRTPRDLTRAQVDDAGNLVFASDGALLAHRLDLDRLDLEVEPVRLADRVFAPGPGAAHFSISRNGVLTYRESATTHPVQLTWLDHTGNVEGTLGPPGDWSEPRLSPSGVWVAATRELAGEPPSVWLLDAARDRGEPLPSGYVAMSPVWSPEGDRLAFALGGVDSPPNPVILSLDGTGEPTQLARLPFEVYPVDWSPDGRHLVVWALPGGGASGELWGIPADGRGVPKRLVLGDRDARAGRVAPGGQWLAYESRDGGSSAIYVTSFPEPGRSRLVSTGGGSEARWSADGSTLYYLAADGTLMSVPVTKHPTLTLGRPEPFVPLHTEPGGPSLPGFHGYDVAREPGRFLIAMPTGERIVPPLKVVVNWHAELER